MKRTLQKSAPIFSLQFLVLRSASPSTVRQCTRRTMGYMSGQQSPSSRGIAELSLELTGGAREVLVCCGEGSGLNAGLCHDGILGFSCRTALPLRSTAELLH